MKKTTHNFHKPLGRALAMALALVMALSLTVQAFAMWPGTDAADSDNYLSAGTLYTADGVLTPEISNIGGFVNLYIVPKGSLQADYIKTPVKIDFGILTLIEKHPMAEKRAYSSVTVPDGGHDMPLIIGKFTGTTRGFLMQKSIRRRLLERPISPAITQCRNSTLKARRWRSSVFSRRNLLQR